MDQLALYKQAPITEALLDFRVSNGKALSSAELRNVLVDLFEEYPQQQDLFTVASEVSFGSTISTTTHQSAIGLLLTSKDGKQVWQVRQDGMTFSRLAPYEKWEPFRDEAHRLWLRYCEISNITKLLRVGMRYINRLDLPSSKVELKDYLRTSPEIALDLSQEMSGFFMQLQLPQMDLKAMLILNEVSVPPPSPEKASVLLDIDLFREVELTIDESFLWNYLEQLRLRKNHIFNSCLTEKMKELIQ